MRLEAIEKKSSRPIIVMGSLNRDLRVEITQFPATGETILASKIASQPGGKGANQAVAAAMLGAPVIMVGCVGDDEAGRCLLSKLAARGIDISGVRTVSNETSGAAVVIVNAVGENMIIVVPGANAEVGTYEVDRALKKVGRTGAVVVSQLEVPSNSALTLMRAVKGSSAVVTMLNASPVEGVESSIFRDVDFVVINEMEAAQLAGSRHAIRSKDDAVAAARCILAAGTHNVVITMGKRGAVLCNGQQELHEPAPAISPVDTTGAGDQFLGALAFAISRGMGPTRSLAMAVRAASLSATRVGAQDSFVGKDEIECWIP